MTKCDIIVPIYNAYEFVEKCIESILENTNFNTAHIILIDDKSSDPKILPLLKNFKKNNPSKITLLMNKKNLGFVKTVNRGMKYSRNDIILLNSDTVVTDGWLEKMRDCAYREKRIATVTPLSNNATLASVPKFNQNNELPNGYNIKKIAKLVEEYSMHMFPEIPSAHGFCMFVKRNVINAIGFFDEDKFGKGYGEEVDFSFRCLERGYKNVLCDDTYVFHNGASSFLVKGSHDEELWKRYPEIRANTDEWYREKKIETIGNNIALALMTKRRKPNILILSGENNALDLVKEINEKKEAYIIHILRKERNDYSVLSMYDNLSLKTAIYRRPLVVWGKEENTMEYQFMLDEIVKNYGISTMIGESFSSSIRDVCQKNKIRIIDLSDELTEKRILDIMKKSDVKKMCYPEVKLKMLQCGLVEDILQKKEKSEVGELKLNNKREKEQKNDFTVLQKIYLKIRYTLRGY